MNLDFNKKNILIFGGANGVGLELASNLNKEGAKIIIVFKTSKNLKKLKKILLKDTTEQLFLIVINSTILKFMKSVENFLSRI